MQDIPFYDFGGSGPLIHFAHPNGFPAETFHRFAGEFTDQYHMIGMNARPMWPGSNPAELTGWDMFADDLITFLDSQGAKNIIGMGISLGGVITMYAALKRPDLFSKLVLIEPVFLPWSIILSSKFVPRPVLEKRSPAGAAKRRRDVHPSRQQAFDRWRQKRAFKRYSDDTLWDYVNYGLVDQVDGSVTLRFPKAWEAEIFSRPPMVWPKISQITHPTLGIRGKKTDVLFEKQWGMWQRKQP
ncbi:MAG: alpha/beta hydrolase, partial [Chloroflexota bacterium]